jgi:hypothetical protein
MWFAVMTIRIALLGAETGCDPGAPTLAKVQTSVTTADKT